MITNPRNRTRARALLGTLLLIWIAGIILVCPVQAGPELPPRDPTFPTQDDNDDDDDSSSTPVGAYIILQADTVSPGAWAVVQWQDSSGGWHDVEGWRGPLSSNNLWWVAAKDFGSGPFRWALLARPEGQLLGTSSPFDLPQQANDRLIVVVALGQ
jgi:hypothetical protein